MKALERKLDLEQMTVVEDGGQNLAGVELVEKRCHLLPWTTPRSQRAAWLFFTAIWPLRAQW